MGKVSMVEIAPTIAEILGISLPGCDGSPINGIFKTGEKDRKTHDRIRDNY